MNVCLSQYQKHADCLLINEYNILFSVDLCVQLYAAQLNERVDSKRILTTFDSMFLRYLVFKGSVFFVRVLMAADFCV